MKYVSEIRLFISVYKSLKKFIKLFWGKNFRRGTVTDSILETSSTSTDPHTDDEEVQDEETEDKEVDDDDEVIQAKRRRKEAKKLKKKNKADHDRSILDKYLEEQEVWL